MTLLFSDTTLTALPWFQHQGYDVALAYTHKTIEICNILDQSENSILILQKADRVPTPDFHLKYVLSRPFPKNCLCNAISLDTANTLAKTAFVPSNNTTL